MDTFPHPRSSNRTCSSPASGFPTRTHARSRQRLRLRHKAQQTVGRPQPLLQKAHILPRTNLVLATQPPSQPPGGMRIHCPAGWTDLTRTEILRPAGQHPVQPLHRLFSILPHMTPMRLLTDPTAEKPWTLALPGRVPIVATCRWDDNCVPCGNPET